MDQLKDFTVIPSNFGGELDISWNYPENKPESSKVYVFKRSKTIVTDNEIRQYFAQFDDLDHFNYNGLMVFDRLDNNIYGFIDMKVLNDVEYYYKAVLRDETTKEISLPVGANAIPRPQLKINIKDGKDIVKTAIEKMFDNVYDTKGNNVKIGKDIKVIKQFAIEPVGENYVMIERVNGSTNTQYWNNQIAIYGTGIIKGDIDSDIIRVTFVTYESPERRDKVANIFRGYKPFLIYVIKMLGAKECTINIEGDYMNPQFHGLNAVGVTMIVSMLFENLMKIDKQKIDQNFSEIKVVED
ncbi:MAG: hypothetical protein ACM34K_05730 [Bacillota bacterium]